MSSREFTDEDRQWITENYPHLSNAKCLEHLKCGYRAFKRLVEECNLSYRDANKYKKKSNEASAKSKWQDNACERYCIDCSFYFREGRCAKTGKGVGALWQKECFKPKEK